MAPAFCHSSSFWGNPTSSMNWYSGPVIHAALYLGSSTTPYMTPLFPPLDAFQSMLISKASYFRSVTRSARRSLP